MARVTAQEYAEKWGRRLSGSTQDIRRGVERVTEAPGQKAAAQSQRMLAGIQEAIADGRWQRAVAGVSLQDWKTATLEKGIGRISSGVEGAMGRQVQMAERLLSAVDSVKSRVDAMPDATLEDRIQRMVAFSRGMSEARIK